MGIRVMLADDHPVVLMGLRNLIDAEADMTVVGEVHEAVRVEPEAGRLQPDVLVLDVLMPELSGLEITRRVTRATPQTRVLILSMHASEGYVVEALRNGALGYVLKGAPPEALLAGIRTVYAGERYLSPPLAPDRIEAYLARASGAVLDAYETLTTREREVLQLVADGLTSAEVGARLFISPRTVETHRANILRKLGLRGQADLLRYAVRRGLIEPTP